MPACRDGEPAVHTVTGATSRERNRRSIRRSAAAVANGSSVVRVTFGGSGSPRLLSATNEV